MCCPLPSVRRTLHIVLIGICINSVRHFSGKIKSNLSAIPLKIHQQWCSWFHHHQGQLPDHKHCGYVISLEHATLQILNAACHVKRGKWGRRQSLLCDLQRRGAPQSSLPIVVVLLPTKNSHPNVVSTCNHEGKSVHRETQKKRRSMTAHASDDNELPPSSLPSLSLPLLLSEPTSNSKPFIVSWLLPSPPLH